MCTGGWSVAGRTVDTGERGGAIATDSRAWDDAEDWQHRVPAMGRGTCREKCRRRGDDVGAGDRELRWGRGEDSCGGWACGRTTLGCVLLLLRRAVALAGVDKMAGVFLGLW
jgi:hypothetical protein